MRVARRANVARNLIVDTVPPLRIRVILTRIGKNVPNNIDVLRVSVDLNAAALVAMTVVTANRYL